MFKSAVIKLKQGLLSRGLIVYTVSRGAFAALYVHVFTNNLTVVGTLQRHISMAGALLLATRTAVYHSLCVH